MSQNLTKLKKTWYARLKKEGFKDIEKNEYILKHYDSYYNRQQNYNYGIRTQRDLYYSMATHFLNDHKFETELERVIWTYHSEGISQRSITKLLTEVKLVSWKSRFKVYQTIKKLKKIMFSLYDVKSYANKSVK